MHSFKIKRYKDLYFEYTYEINKNIVYMGDSVISDIIKLIDKNLNNRIEREMIGEIRKILYDMYNNEEIDRIKNIIRDIDNIIIDDNLEKILKDNGVYDKIPDYTLDYDEIDGDMLADIINWDKIDRFSDIFQIVATYLVNNETIREIVKYKG